MNARTVFGWWFTLVALYAVVTYSSGVADALGVVGDKLRSIGDPTVPLIRDRSGAAATTGTTYINPVPGASNGGGGGGAASW
jgi:hypothetical protein